MNTQQIAKELLHQIEHENKSTQEVVEKLLVLLEKYKLLALVPSLLNSLETILSVRSQTTTHITTANKISKELLLKLCQKYNIPENTPNLLNEKILGGYIVETEDRRIDASIDTQLDQLHHELVHSV